MLPEAQGRVSQSVPVKCNLLGGHKTMSACV